MTDLSNKPISYTGSHPLELAYRALLARAEAAEAEVATLKALCEKRHDEWRTAEGERDAERARAEAAEARVAELEEAQQAAYNLGFADAAERFAGERVEPLIVSLEPQ